MKDSDLDGMPSAASYGDIRDWIAENYDGMKVSNLYIAQMKDKFGLEKRKNYNTGSGKGRVPHVTPEKTKAITAAFRHFGMIPAPAYEEE